MALSPTNRYMNVSVSWTPAGGSLGALTGIKSAQFNEGIETLQESADYDLYHTVGGVTLISPTITLRTIDAFMIYATAAGQVGTLIITFRDFTNGAGAGGGAKTVTMTGAYLAQRSKDAEYRQLGTANVTFQSVSSDGATSPIAIAAL